MKNLTSRCDVNKINYHDRYVVQEKYNNNTGMSHFLSSCCDMDKDNYIHNNYYGDHRESHWY